MTVQEIYIRTLGWVKYESLTKEQIDYICDTLDYHGFAFNFHCNALKNQLGDILYQTISGIRRRLWN